MRNPTRLQVLVLNLFGTWVLLLAIALYGGTILGLPRVVTTVAGVIAVLVVFFFVPVAQLYVLLLERRRGKIWRKGYSVLAVQRRWYYAVLGVVAAVIGFLLLLASSKTMVEIRFAAVTLLTWGLLCIWVAVLAFRTKPWLADTRRTR